MISCRLAVHTLPDGNSHVDLFICPEDSGDLLTYEIASENIPSLEILFQKKKNPVFILTDSRKFSDRENCSALSGGSALQIPLTEKKPHRRIYMTYEGILSDGRGEIKHLGSGFLEKIPKKCLFLSEK